MRPGQLDRLITIEKNTKTRSESGAAVDGWAALVSNEPAQVRTVGGGERFRGAHIVAEATTSFVIRFRTGLDEAMRIQYPPVGGDAYDIHKIDEIGRREGLLIQASRSLRTP